MLDDNPFLEREDDTAPREEFGLSRADSRTSEGDRTSESATESEAAGADGSSAESTPDSDSLVHEGWDGDGSVDMAADDGEWGGEAPARGTQQNRRCRPYPHRPQRRLCRAGAVP